MKRKKIILVKALTFYSLLSFGQRSTYTGDDIPFLPANEVFEAVGIAFAFFIVGYLMLKVGNSDDKSDNAFQSFISTAGIFVMLFGIFFLFPLLKYVQVIAPIVALCAFVIILIRGRR